MLSVWRTALPGQVSAEVQGEECADRDEESAEIAFAASEFAGEADYMEPNTNKLSKFQYGITDSGATASLGSVDALEELMIANIHACGDSKMQVNTSKRPTFKFGNGMRKECLSTINLFIGAGEKRGEHGNSCP